MKKVFMMLTLLLMAGATFAAKQSWEVVEGILKGGVDSGGPYIYKSAGQHVCPSHLPCMDCVNLNWSFYTDVAIGFGEFELIESGKAEQICPETGELMKRNFNARIVTAADGGFCVRFSGYRYGGYNNNGGMSPCTLR
eukprot:TRINITY_DN3283_c0_g4_i4.p4 TRINITY_DN3283_c0_g4~~TRINITY_DN3283_c0_g4_i4.p4  ORF type:complete len:138 (+),score=4.82 TRINITY_DN3283_c0_g4_i4:376-789(+)